MIAAPLILASGSEARTLMLRRAGIPHVADPPAIDEAAIKADCRAAGLAADACAARLAAMKALEITPRHPRALVLGADQMLDCDGTWFDKPTDRTAASTQLAALAGRTHVLLTAVVIARDDEILWHRVAAASLTMRPLTAEQIDRYLDQAGPEIFNSVGGYQLEGLGAALFSRTEGDFFTILGLPLLPVLEFLREHGIGL